MMHALSFPTLSRPRSGLLYVRSRESAPPALPALAVAVVGSPRGRSPHGFSHGGPVAFAFASRAAESGFAVVSGLALGCDSAARAGSQNLRGGCVAAGGITIAVLPCGLDRVAPVSNTKLANSILSANGFLASEYPPGPAGEACKAVRNFRFVERNRVIVSLSRAVVVTEAQLKSGTMHAAHFAREQNKPLACYIPTGESASPGCLHLVRRCGATPLRNSNELKLFLETLSHESRQPCESWRKGGGGCGRV